MPSTVHQFMPADDGPKIILLDLQSTLSANFRQMGTNPVPARIRDEEQYKQYLVDWLRQVQQVGWEVRSCPGAWCKSVALYAAPGG